jgi:hypothetical protein
MKPTSRGELMASTVRVAAGSVQLMILQSH